MTYWKVFTDKLRESEQPKTTFTLCNQDTVQKNEPASYTRLKNMTIFVGAYPG